MKIQHSFPLDHLAECTNVMSLYLNCLRESNFVSNQCREETKQYLECRMERELMAKEDLKQFGFTEKALW